MLMRVVRACASSPYHPDRGEQMTGYALSADLRDDLCRLVLAGEIDICAADHVADLGIACLAVHEVPVLLIDLDEVRFLDARGLSALVRIRNAALLRNKEVVLRNPGPQVRKILMLTGLAEAFRLEPPGLLESWWGGWASPPAPRQPEAVRPRLAGVATR
jgi:anti-anti-sigma factor